MNKYINENRERAEQEEVVSDKNINKFDDESIIKIEINRKLFCASFKKILNLLLFFAIIMRGTHDAGIQCLFTN